MVSRKALLPPPDAPDAAGMTNRTVVEEVTSTATEQQVEEVTSTATEQQS